MSSRVNIAKVDIEDAVDAALHTFKQDHNRDPRFLIIGRLAYEELRDMLMIGRRGEGMGAPQAFRGMTLVVVEEPADALTLGCTPD